MPDLFEAAEKYREKFGDTPTYVMIPESKDDEAAAAMLRAVAIGKPFKNDAEWFKTIGLTPPPDGVPI